MIFESNLTAFETGVLASPTAASYIIEIDQYSVSILEPDVPKMYIMFVIL